MAATPGYRPPRLDRYLLDGERVVFAVRRHWASVAAPVLAALAAVVLALYADAKLPRGASLVANVLAIAAVGVTLWALWRVIEWRHDWLVATDKRLLLSTGLITQKTPMMPLARVTDMNYQRGPLGRLLGYGTFVMESAGQEQALSEIEWMPDPDHNYRVLVAEIFGVEDEDRPTPPQYAEWEEPQGGLPSDDRSRAIPLRDKGGDAGSVYRSPDLQARDRSADTGPIPRYPRDDER